ncbi:hypothetical protein D8674_007881 [Pyrus ussuriensis x Pyrus communis]|uniref:Uncharacterized protein n=1 Tax=Pyrus ussuriensis x Pyrus communis TaxID=2448454 RepID=A0A5N5HW29_9ROSA|nr:hypothetical protein D8674_007881 [Pyrus ussuriensis x Pyrus communis]
MAYSSRLLGGMTCTWKPKTETAQRHRSISGAVTIVLFAKGDSMDRTWAVVGVSGSSEVPSSRIPEEDDQVGPCEQLDGSHDSKPILLEITPKVSLG